MKSCHTEAAALAAVRNFRANVACRQCGAKYRLTDLQEPEKEEVPSDGQDRYYQGHRAGLKGGWPDLPDFALDDPACKAGYKVGRQERREKLWPAGRFILLGETR